MSAAGGEVTTRIEDINTHKPAAAIVVYGETPYAEFQGDRETLDFSAQDAAHLETLRRLHAAHIPVISVFLSGRPLWVNRELNLSEAFVAAWLPGSEGAGVADVLFGDRAAGGKLPHSWPRSADQVPINVGDADYDPLFPFGFGLTYG